MTAIDRLSKIEARANAATKGPWYRYGTWPYEIFAPSEPDGGPYVASVTGDDGHNESNSEFIAHARTDVANLVAALRAVLTLADGWQEHAESVTNVYGKQVISVEFAHAEIVSAIEEALS